MDDDFTVAQGQVTLIQKAAAGEAGKQSLVPGQGAEQRQRLLAGRLQGPQRAIDGGRVGGFGGRHSGRHGEISVLQNLYHEDR